MDRSGNLFIIEEDYTSNKTEASSSSNIEAIDHKNANKENNERDREFYTAANTNEQDRESCPAAIQTSKRYKELYDVGIKNIKNNETKSAAKSNREKLEYETNQRTAYNTDKAANENDRTFEFEEANRKRSGNLFIVEINNDINIETNSTTTLEKRNSTTENSKKEDITKDANASKKEDITKDANASKKEDIKKDANASHTEASVEEGRVVLQLDAGHMQEKDVRKENVQLLTEKAELCNRSDRQRVENIFLLGKPALSNKRSVDIQSEIHDIFDDITKLCKLQKRVNILLLGKSGAGKSGFINTMYKAITGKYHKIANTGTGNTQSVTPSLIWYDHCGVVIELVDNEQRQIQLSECLKHFPNIIDFAGLGDEDTESINVILDRLLGGCIEAGTDCSTLFDLQTQAGVDCLNTDKLPGMAVTHVIFVQSWRDSVPVKLIECLTKVMKRVDEYGARIYPVDVIVLLTRYDELIYPSEDLTAQEIQKNKDVFDKCKQEFAKYFHFVGSVSEYMVDWINYSENIKAEDTYLDNRKDKIDLTAIKLLRRFLQPGVPKQRPLRKLIDWKMKLKIMANTVRYCIRQLVFFAIIVGMVSVVMYSLLSATPALHKRDSATTK